MNVFVNMKEYFMDNLIDINISMIYDCYVDLKSNTVTKIEDYKITLSDFEQKISAIVLFNHNIVFFYFISLGKTIWESICLLSEVLLIDFQNASLLFDSFLRLIQNYVVISNTAPQRMPKLSIRNIKRMLEFHSNELIPDSVRTNPFVVSLYITNSCKANCIYCFANSKKTMSSVDSKITIDTFRSIVRQAQEMGVSRFELTGGDPFCVNGITEYFKIVIDSGMQLVTSTKMKIDLETCAQLVKIGMPYVQLSLDSFNELTVNYLMGKTDGYKGIMESISNLQKSGIPIRIKSVITSKNINDIPEFVVFLNNKGISEVSFSWYGNMCGRHDSFLYPTNDDIFRLNNKMNDLINVYGNIKIEYSPLGEEWLTFQQENSLYKHNHRRVCLAGRNRLAINEDGNVCFCEYLQNEKELFVGNIYQDSLKNIWYGEKMKSILLPSKNLFENSSCYSCSDFEKCYRRRCFLRSKQYTGSVFGMDPWCKYGDQNYKIY